MTHTPAPWHVGDGKRSMIVYDEQGYAIANAITYHTHHDPDAAAANAHLIAAAPDLLAALSAMVDRWEPDCTGADRRMWEAARDAIDKATQPAEQPATT